MARGTKTVYPGKQNQWLSSTFQPPEEDRSVQRPKRCDKRSNENKDYCPKNVNNVRENSYKISDIFYTSPFTF